MKNPLDPDLERLVEMEIQQAKTMAQLHEQAAHQMAGVLGEPQNRAERRRLERVRRKGHA